MQSRKCLGRRNLHVRVVGAQAGAQWRQWRAFKHLVLPLETRCHVKPGLTPPALILVGFGNDGGVHENNEGQQH